MFLVSSNPKKLKEFARYGLELTLRSGADLPEVQGTPEEVALHKAKLAGPGAVVEDTILTVDGDDWVDVKWQLDALTAHAGKPVRWQVTLAHNDGEQVHLYTGTIDGQLVLPPAVREGAFGFDPFVQPEGSAETLDELEVRGEKDAWSARRRATEALLRGKPQRSVPLALVGEWTGAWQAADAPPAARRPKR